MVASDTIDVRLVRSTEGLRLRAKVLRWALWTVGVSVAFLLSSLPIGDFPAPPGMRRLQIIRRSTDEVVVAGESPPYRSKPLLMVIRRDADRLDEAALLAKWGEPHAWRRLLDHERY